jgi:hypothetical protein
MALVPDEGKTQSKGAETLDIVSAAEGSVTLKGSPAA